jgi:hypothetical protein
MAAVAVQQTEAVQAGQEGAAWMIELERKLLEAKGLTTGRAILRQTSISNIGSQSRKPTNVRAPRNSLRRKSRD